MNLFYVPGACSLAVHIALIEAGMPYTLIAVDRNKHTSDSRNFLDINPKGYVPALEMDDGQVLTENPAILAYIADYSGKLLPEQGMARWRVLEAIAFMSTEFHTNFKPFFYSDTSQEQRDKAGQMLVRRFTTLADQSGDSPYLVGNSFTIADAYLFVMLRWARHFQIDVPSVFDAYYSRLQALPSVVQALDEEELH